MISARAMNLNGAPRIFVHVAGVGPMAPAQEIHATCERMMHLDLIEPPSAAPGEIAAHGLCPQTMDTIDLSVLPGEGALITLALSSVEATQDDHEPDHDAHGAGAWLINVDDALARSWTRRLQRLGWAVSRFSSYQAAMDQLHNVPRSARPALVIVLETGNPAKDGALDLAALLPGWSRLVYAVETGSITLRRPQDVVSVQRTHS